MRLLIILLFICSLGYGQAINLDNDKSPVLDSVTIGNSTNGITLGEVSGIKLYGNATQWDDVTVSALSLAGGVQAPTLRALIGGINQQAFNYQTANDIVYGQVQFPHAWMYDDSIEIHYHCAIETTPSAGDTVVVDFEYSWADISDVFPTSDTIQSKIPVAAWTAKQHKLVEVGKIPGTGLTLSSVLIFRIERRRDLGSDTYDSSNNWWYLADIDFHIRKDKFGSNNETSN